ncbi:kinase-like domain-containing protein [Lentinula edodes]|nr:kinase-like domain-containing protein [Lentinula edodes]
MATESINDPTICQDFGNNVDAYQCGQQFPNKTDFGPCGRCILLGKAISDEEREKQKKYPYCRGCATVMQMLTTDFCGNTGDALVLSIGSNSSQSRQLDLAKLSQNQSTQAYIFRESHASTVPITTGFLNTVRAEASDSSRIRVVVLPAVSKGHKVYEVSTLGVFDNTVRNEMLFQDLWTQVVSLFDDEWTKDSQNSLSVDDVIPRWWPGNLVPMKDAILGTIGEFHQYHNHQPNPKPYQQTPSAHFGKQQEGKYFVLYGLIKVTQYVTPGPPRLRAKRRRNGDINQSNRNVSAGMPSMRAPLISSFMSVPTHSSNIQLCLANIVQNRQDCKSLEVYVTWPDDDDALEDIIQAKLDDRPFSSGMNKEVFNLTMEGYPDLYVAKRLYNSSQSNSCSNAILQEENTQELQLEVERTYFVKFFLDWFFKIAREHGIDVKTSIPLDVTTVFLAKEVLSSTNPCISFPSPASGISDNNIGERNMITWLIEPRRANLVKKWSGTNVHVPHSHNKLGSILTTFAHFVYQMSNENMVLSDIQTASGKNVDGVLCELLFDVGLHSTNKQFGLSDFGQEGLQLFTQQHICNQRWHSKKMNYIQVLQI